MTKLKKHSLLLLLATCLLVFLTGCQKNMRGESITIVGSSALQPLVEAAGESYSGKHPGKFINVQGGGSGTGLSQIQAGAVQIGNSDLFAEEKENINAKSLIDHRVAVVGITPVVHKGTGVKNITLKQLQAIFTGEITNWREVGGKNQKIVLLNRAKGSGTRATFEKYAMHNKPSKQAQEQDSTGMVRQIVAETPGAISYMAFSYADKSVQKLSIDGIAPTDENVQTNKWTIWSYEHMYTKGKPTGLTKEFMDYMLSKEVQEKIVAKIGYIPVAKMQVSREVDGKVERLNGQK